jgi:hypothetical protein
MASRCTLTPESSGIKVTTPYDAGWVMEFKSSIPVSGRRPIKNGKQFYWIVAPQYGKVVQDLCNKYFNELPLLPQIANVVRNDALPRFDPGYVQNNLGRLVENFGKSSKVETYTELAEKLSRIAHKKNPWSWRYIQSVHVGLIEPSEKFVNALEILLADLDGLPAFIAETAPITVYARPGAIHLDAIVLSESKTCANPTCTVHFVPRVPWQKYCPNCKGKKHYGK